MPIPHGDSGSKSGSQKLTRGLFRMNGCRKVLLRNLELIHEDKQCIKQPFP